VIDDTLWPAKGWRDLAGGTGRACSTLPGDQRRLNFTRWRKFLLTELGTAILVVRHASHGWLLTRQLYSFRKHLSGDLVWFDPLVILSFVYGNISLVGYHCAII